MIKDDVFSAITDVFQDDEYGFEVFMCMKGESRCIKRLKLYEGTNDGLGEDNFKLKIQYAIEEVIEQMYLNDNAQYDVAENIEDNQKKFYIFKQSETYNPFEFLSVPAESVPFFNIAERSDISGIVFKFRRSTSTLWAYQHYYSDIVANKKSSRFFSLQKGDTFIEMDEPLFTINKKVDMLIINDSIITDNIALLQRSFGFEEFVRSSSRSVIDSIDHMGVVANIDKLSQYTDRSKLTYAKKLMRIKKYCIFDIPASIWVNKVQTVERWKGVFSISASGKIEINSYKDVENLINLLSEQYTRSDVTGREYETEVKKPAQPKAAV